MESPIKPMAAKTFYFARSSKFFIFSLFFILISNKSFTEEGSSWTNVTPLFFVMLADLSDWNQRCYGFYNGQASLMGNKTEERDRMMRVFSGKSVSFINTAIRFDAEISGNSLEDQMLITFASGNKYTNMYSDALFQGITSTDENEKKLHELRTKLLMKTCDDLKVMSSQIK